MDLKELAHKTGTIDGKKAGKFAELAKARLRAGIKSKIISDDLDSHVEFLAHYKKAYNMSVLFDMCNMCN